MIERPHSSFTRTVSERSVRPREIHRLSFGDLLQSLLKNRQRTGREGDHIVTIEAARAGDAQVLAAAEPRTNPAGPPISLNGLARLPTVESIVTSTEVTLGTRLTSVREFLFVDAGPPVPQPEVFALLPNLTSLHAMATHSAQRLSLDALKGLDLRDLALTWMQTEPGQLRHVASFHDLQRLAINAGPADGIDPIGRLPKLRYVFIDGGRSGWERLGELDQLEEVVLWGARLQDLHAFARWLHLRSLWLRGRRIKSIEGIGSLKSLDTLSLEALGISDISPLQGLEQLTALELNSLGVDNLEALSGLPSLRRVTLTGAGKVWRVKSLAPLIGLKYLQELKVRSVATAEGELAAFRKARPEVVLEAQPDPAQTSITVGWVEIHPPTKELPDWWVLDDLAGLLNIDTNAEAEARLQYAISRRSPALLGRLRFDSESGAVGVTASSESDIREVAAIITDLVQSRESGSR